MAQKVLILGDSGTGKSASLRNFSQDEVLVINSAGKPLPFKNHFEAVTPAFNKLTADVLKAMDSTNKKVIIIDDAQYIMSFQYMRRIKENGWDKWNDIQGDFFNIIQHCDDLPADTIVYFLSHIQRDDEGHEKLKTMGKMLDEKITLEGLFTVVLKTSVKDGEYCFITQNSGMDTVKSPIGMFDTYAIDNDLKYVDTKIRNYYEIGDYADDEKVAQMDQEAKKESITKEAASGRRSRRSQKTESQITTDIQGSGTSDGQGTVSKLTSSDRSDHPAGAERSEVTDDEKLQEIMDLTDQRVKAMEGIEGLHEARRRRSRKVRNGEDKEEVNKEAPAEETKEKTTAEAPKRRRRRNTLTEEDITDPSLDAFNEDDLPFEI